MTEPIEKPPKTVFSGVVPVRSQVSSWKRASCGVGGVERVVVREADARDDVPVLARPARDLQRAARRDDVQPPLRVEHVGEAEQVVLVGAAAVVEDEQALGRAGGGPLAVDQSRSRASTAAGSRRGAACASSCVAQVLVLGRERAAPRPGAPGPRRPRSPGESVAISNRTPLGIAEVDRLEVVAVAHVGDVAARRRDALLPRELVLVTGGPGDVVDAARALLGRAGRRVVGEAEPAVGAVEQVLAVALEVKPSSSVSSGSSRPANDRVGAGAVQARDRVLGRDVRMGARAAARCRGRRRRARASGRRSRRSAATPGARVVSLPRRCSQKSSAASSATRELQRVDRSRAGRPAPRRGTRTT